MTQASSLRWFGLIARVFVGLNLLYYSLGKIGMPSDFLKNIRLYEFLPEDPPSFLNGTAIVLPWLELLAGGLLLIGLLRRGTAAVVTVMLIVFSGAIFARTLQVMEASGQSFTEIAFDCGCGSGEVIIWQKLGYNLLLIAVSALLVAWKSDAWAVDARLRRRT